MASQAQLPQLHKRECCFHRIRPSKVCRSRWLCIALVAVMLLARNATFILAPQTGVSAPPWPRARLLQPEQRVPLARVSLGQPKTSRPAVGVDVAGASGPAGTALALAVLSSFFNGAFPAFARIPSGPPLDPVIFNGLVCVGVFLSSLLVPVIAGTPALFTLAGALGGVLFVFAALFSFIAIPRAGLATAQAVWSCSAIVVSFAWGAFGPAEISAPVQDLALSLVAIGLLVAGALTIVNCDSIANSFSGAQVAPSEGSQEDVAAEDKATGVACALAVGLFGGSVLVPFKYVPPEAAGLTAVPSFGVGALVAGVAVTLAYWTVIKGKQGLPSAGADASLAGLASGAMWNAGNVCSILAQSPPFSLAYGIAYPILQCALVFGGLLGIYAFNEIQGSAIAVFWGGALSIAAGIVTLSLHGPGA